MRRAARFCLLLLVIAIIVAIQRDTFVRRWLLPAPADAAAQPADLERRVPAVRHINGNIQSAIAALSKASGLAITVDEPVVKAFEGQYISLELRDVTVEDALNAIPRSDRERDCRLMLVRRGDAFVLRRATDASLAMSLRVYDIDEMLPAAPPSPRPPITGGGGGLFGGRTPISPADARLEAAANIAFATEAYILDTTGRDMDLFYSSIGGNMTPICIWQNNRLIVIAPEIDQPRAAMFLHALNEPRR